MPHQMSKQEILSFLTEAPWTGQVATVRANGRPHVATVWFTVDAGDIVFVTSSQSVKAKNLRRSPFAAFSVDDDTHPYSYAVAEGAVSLVDELEQVRAWAMEIATRYIGLDGARAYTQSDTFPDDLVCRLTPSHLSGVARLAAGSD